MAYATINKGSSYFTPTLYTGTGGTQSITTVGFKPDFTWVKNRSGANSNALFDSVRGAGLRISTNETGAEVNNTGNFTAFISNGFSLAGAGGETNVSTNNYVSWNWLGSNTTTSNASGTLTSTVCANTTSGFSVCTFNEAASYSGVQTFGHGLGVAPSMVIYRQYNTASNWQVYHKATGTGITQLNNTSAVNTSATFWPTVNSTVFGLSENVQAPTYASVAYCFAEIKGYSRFGSYTGNGSNDGTFVYTGFKPAYVMIKQTNTSGNDWYVYDNKRETYNFMDNILRPNTADADTITTVVSLDFLSNGIKMRGTNTGMNGSGSTYIYAAFAENPFVLTDGTPVTAR